MDTWRHLVVLALVPAAVGGNLYGTQPARPARPRLAVSTGSAFIVHSDGYLITNAHVIENAVSIKAKVNGAFHDARLIRSMGGESADGNSADLALVRVGLSGLTPLPFGDFAQRGEKVFAFGFPLASTLGVDLKMTEGIVSGFRSVPVPRRPSWLPRVPAGRPHPNYHLQIDAALNPGNSGGPVVNEWGEVVGVATGGLSGTQSLNFAQPISLVKYFLETNVGNEGPTRWVTLTSRRRLDGIALDRFVAPSVVLLVVQTPISKQ